MKRNVLMFFPLFLALALLGTAQPTTQIELKNNWYYLNGERFFIKAIGYEIGARPGQHPYEGAKVEDLDLMQFDLDNIKAGGYNTIRTWSQFSEAQLKLVQASGLKLIMGLEVNPEEDYGNPVFIDHCKAQLNKLLAYAKNYDCIITYLVINEPQTDHIHRVTGKSFMDLMQLHIDIIHVQHPGIPVTLSANAMISDYMNESIFDVYAYNCYDHIEGQTATMGFKNYIDGLVKLNGSDKPFITTEFGYSVSPYGGNGRYGSNTLQQQSEGLIANYRDLIDAGAVGMCPFYYADGWWKGGNKSDHSVDQPEEWFGFWGYSSIDDKFGSPRPVWFALRDYMQALIVNPKNNSIHIGTTVPIELYTNEAIKKVVVKFRDKVIYTKAIQQAGYVADQLSIDPIGIMDMELAFEFYDTNNHVVKTESIIILASKTAIELPKMTIEVTPNKDLNAAKIATVTTTLVPIEKFTLVGDIVVSFNTHLGWAIGPQESAFIANKANTRPVTFEHYFTIPENCWVVNASAGIGFKYGKFTGRIHDQQLIYRGDWAKEVGRK